MQIEDSAEDFVWRDIDPDEIWAMDKLILSRKLGYICGPVGLDVPTPGYYCVRPCVNMLGLGLGTQKVWLEQETMHLPIGHFWCEWFDGRHLSVDYWHGKQMLCVEGFKADDTFTKWERWVSKSDKVPLPFNLKTFTHHTWLNVEYIGGKVIEIHFRRNDDFEADTTEFIPVWEGESIDPPVGYRYKDYPDIHGRIGAFIR